MLVARIWTQISVRERDVYWIVARNKAKSVWERLVCLVPNGPESKAWYNSSSLDFSLEAVPRAFERDVCGLRSSHRLTGPPRVPSDDEPLDWFGWPDVSLVPTCPLERCENTTGAPNCGPEQHCLWLLNKTTGKCDRRCTSNCDSYPSSNDTLRYCSSDLNRCLTANITHPCNTSDKQACGGYENPGEVCSQEMATLPPNGLGWCAKVGAFCDPAPH